MLHVFAQVLNMSASKNITMFGLYWVRCPMCPCRGLPASTEETSDCLLITSIHLPLCFDRHFLSFCFGLSFQTLKCLWNINVFISCLHFLSVGHVEKWHRFHLNHDLCEGKDTCSSYTKFCTSMETKAWNCEQKFGSTKPTHVYTELKGRTLHRLRWHNNDEFMSGKNLASISEGEDMRKELLKKTANFCHEQQNNSLSVSSLRTLMQKFEFSKQHCNYNAENTTTLFKCTHTEDISK